MLINDDLSNEGVAYCTVTESDRFVELYFILCLTFNQGGFPTLVLVAFQIKMFNDERPLSPQSSPAYVGSLPTHQGCT